MTDAKPLVIAILGPTASGKTALSLALAQELNAEIIACDSRTIYRHFDIGTAKPSAQEQARVRHHLIDVLEPDENYTAANFAEQAGAIIADLTAQGKVPIVCGGTGFYARALLEGLSIPQVPPQEQLRKELADFADRQGNEALHARLKAVDPSTAERLGVNDRFRIIRALEVTEFTGKPFSEVAVKVDPPFDTIWIGLTAEDRSFLKASIRQRFQEQLDAGMLDETRRLYERYGRSQKLMHTVNYKQIVQFLEGEIEEEQAYSLALIHNEQLARRQLMWFRANQSIEWFAIDKLAKPDLKAAVASYIKESSAQKRLAR